MGSARGIVLDLLPDEKVVYRELVALAPRLDFLPKSLVIATTRRMIVRKPFGSQHSVSYDKVGSIDFRRGSLNSKLVLRMVHEKKPVGSFIVVFGSAAKALSAFAIVSNQIAASRDKNHGERISHMKVMEQSRYLRKAEIARATAIRSFELPQPELKRQGRTVRMISTVMGQLPSTQKFIKEKGNRGITIISLQARCALPMMKGAIGTAVYRSRLTLSQKLIPFLILNMRNARSRLISQSQGIERAANQEKFEVTFFAGDGASGIALGNIDSSGDTMMMVQKNKQMVERHYRSKPEKRHRLNPERDLKIFRVRQMRNSGGKHIPKQRPSLFNIFSD